MYKVIGFNRKMLIYLFWKVRDNQLLEQFLKIRIYALRLIIYLNVFAT